jgi:hypothetical protein
MDNGAIALFKFELLDNEIAITAEKHYRLVPSSDLTTAELEIYKTRAN